jgi:hypothetical protein
MRRHLIAPAGQVVSAVEGSAWGRAHRGGNCVTSDADGGGPAFPAQPAFHYTGLELTTAEQKGMSLRDWFAGQALLAIAAGGASAADAAPKTVARNAYRIADAMIEHRGDLDKGGR